MKSIFKSKTFWIATAQAVLAAAAVYQHSVPEWAGQIAIGISILQVIVRFLTTEPVSL